MLLQYDYVAACENMYYMYVVIDPPADDFFVLAGPCSVIIMMGHTDMFSMKQSPYLASL